ncbi:hypothetical protein CsSME_00021548 [Camellia sinensis var. sinensis]
MSREERERREEECRESRKSPLGDSSRLLL